MPFRENILSYPRRSLLDEVNNAAKSAPTRPPFNQANGAAKKPVVTPQQRNAQGQPQQQKPEDKDSPEYKKKQALMAGPILNMAYQNSGSYEMQESLFTALKDIFEAVVLSDKRSGVVSPTKFLETLRKENEMFRSAMHQDAHEFLNLLLNAVVENIEAHDKIVKEKKALGEPTEEPEDPFADPETDRPDTGTVSFPSILPTPVSTSPVRWLHELFEGTLTSETRCLTCENTSQRDEPFLDLSVDLEQHSSVTACLRRFSEEEMLCERNKFHCDNCGGLQEAEKRMKIKRLPKVLALHLKRFKYTEDLQRLQKLFHKVVYPYHLRLFNTTDDAEDPDRIYELYAVVVHIGGGPYHGHYVAIIKTQDRGWLLFDDEMVEPVDKSYVRNFFGDKPGMACAYVLFYQETTLEAVQKEQRTEGKRRKSADAPVGLGLHQRDSAELHRVVSSPVNGGEEGFVSLNHAATAPPFLDPNGHVEPPKSPTIPHPSAVRPGSPVIQSKKEKQKEEKARKEEEKARKAAEKQAEKDKTKAEQNRRTLLTEKLIEARKKNDDDLKAAMDASKESKADEDKRRGVEPSESAANGHASAPKGLDMFKRSKSLRFGSLSRKKEEKPVTPLPTVPANGATESTSALVDDDHTDGVVTNSGDPPKEKEKKNRFSLRKKSFGML